MTSLTCPDCRGEMRTYDRNGVTVDQCQSCRGLFLDRGYDKPHKMRRESLFEELFD
jgi:Zn-finger nucleic acid-binding protein